ncbi:MAG: 7-cyano-7-deazaguanine synthase [Deltaproteobacteria bacterium]|nr:7-cyano-7-deazaguanine synthase [Deltaproteobacteria bacterium]
MKSNKIAVMFSGGTDSTYAAWLQLPKYDQIYLITFIRYGLRRAENLQEAVNRLMQKVPSNAEIHHKTIDIENIYQSITPHQEKQQAQQEVLNQKIGPLWEDPHGIRNGREKYMENMQKLFMANECLQCKIAMDIAAIKFCKENNITNICDGSNTEQLDDGSQLEDVKVIARDIFNRYGINFFSPAFNISAEERCQTLYNAGITDHPDHKKMEKTHQIPSRQIQCTIPSSVLWTSCIFPWMVYDGQSCNDYIEMCRLYFKNEIEKGLEIIDIKP